MSEGERVVKRKAVILFSWLGILFSVGFTFVNLKRGFLHIAMVNGGMLAIFSLNLLTFMRDRNVARAGGIGLSVIMMFTMIATRSLGSAAIVWIYIIPIPAFFFMGLKWGRRFIVAWGAVILGLFLVMDLPPGLAMGLKLELLTVYVLAGVVAFKLEQLRMEDARRIKALAREAQSASETKDHFLAHMSHELRTPLNSILGFSQIISQKPSLAPDLKPDLERIQSSGAELLDLVETILVYAQLKTGTLERIDEDVAVSDLVTEMLEVNRAQAEAREVTVRDETDGDFTLRGDRRLLGQAVSRLLINAIRSVPSGGEVAVRCRVESGFHLTIQFTGSEVEERELAALLEPFGKMDQPDGVVVDGIGLNLAIVQLIAQIHGGWIDCLSARSSGVSCELALPESILTIRDDSSVAEMVPQEISP